MTTSSAAEQISALCWAAAQLADWNLPAPPTAPTGGRMRDWIESGVPALTGPHDQPPLIPPGAAATAALGCEVAFAALTGIEPVRSWHQLLAMRGALTGAERRGPWSVGGTCRAVRCADGYVAVNLARPEDVEAVAAVVEHGDVVDNAYEAWRRLDAWAPDITCAEVAARVQLLGVPGGVVPVPGEWWPASHAQEGVAGSPVVRTDFADGAGRTDAPLVVDLSSLWAGPLCTKLLGGAGAKVVKIEIASRLDGARRANAAFYNYLHAGHDAVLLDLKEAADRELLRRLITKADIVVDSSRPRAMQSWGIDVQQVCTQSPTTWVSITAYGRRFPERVGFGDDVAMAAGLVARAMHDDQPLPCGDAIADPLTGMHAALHALASHRTGGSRLLDIAMAEAVAGTVAWSPGSATPVEHAPAPEMPAPTDAAAPPGRDTAKWRSA